MTVAAVNAPGMTGGSSLIMEGAATGSGPSESATGIALDQSSTGAGPQNSSAEGEYNPGVDSATGVSSGSSVDDAIDETEGSLEGDISRINALSEQVETYKRAARAAQKDADAGSNIILSEESDKAENDQLERTKPAKMPVSIMNQVLPRDGAKAAGMFLRKFITSQCPQERFWKTSRISRARVMYTFNMYVFDF